MSLTGALNDYSFTSCCYTLSFPTVLFAAFYDSVVLCCAFPMPFIATVFIAYVKACWRAESSNSKLDVGRLTDVYLENNLYYICSLSFFPCLNYLEIFFLQFSYGVLQSP